MRAMEAELLELRREIETRDAFLARVSATLDDVVERFAKGATTVDELRGFARELAIIAGNAEARVPRRASIDAARHVEKTVTRWRVKTQGQVTIHAETKRAGDARGRWDPDLLDTILGELVSNACKYSRGRPVTVRVEGDVGTVRIVVDDEGAGIDEEEAPPSTLRGRRFRRGSDGETAKLPGFGVGVWLTHLLATAHGGTFRLARRPHGGTRAVVELPRSDDDQRASP